MRRDWSAVLGEKHGRLTVTAVLGRDAASKMVLRFRCDCGNSIDARYNNVAQGTTRSCGCLGREVAAARFRTHGLSGDPVFQCWVDMNKRCYNPAMPCFEHYGGRGITVCDRWRDSPKNFIADMGPRPPGYTLERLDNERGYSPDNCEWRPMVDQQNNKRTNRLLTYAGKTQTVSQWARALGLPKGTLSHRLRSGWPLERALAKRAALNDIFAVKEAA